MSAYFDTSVWMSYYLRDSNYQNALALRATHADAIWTIWQSIEFNNAVRACVVTRNLNAQLVRGVGKALQSDLSQRRMRPIPMPVYAWWQEAEALSKAHATTLGVRTLDLLHVAAARVLKATHFCTFDTRQHALARAAGLRIN